MLKTEVATNPVVSSNSSNPVISSNLSNPDVSSNSSNPVVASNSSKPVDPVNSSSGQSSPTKPVEKQPMVSSPMVTNLRHVHVDTSKSRKWKIRYDCMA